MARYNATIASVFPMEARVYREAGADLVFVGHPLIDIVKVHGEHREICQDLELDPEKKIIGLLPGSRKQEIDSLLPEMLKTAERIQKETADYQFIIPLAKGIDKEKVSRMAANYELILKLVEGKAYEVMSISDLIITASGTATLEAAIIGTPMVIIYKVSPFTYRLGKKVLGIEYIGMPNIIANREIAPELIQEKANSDYIYKTAMSLLNKPHLLNNTRVELRYVKEKLGSSGALKRTAELLLKKGGL